MIVKIQKPLATNEDQPMVLMYNEDRTFEHFIPMDENFEALMGDDVKQYWELNMQIGPDDDGDKFVVRGWIFAEQLEAQPW